MKRDIAALCGVGLVIVGLGFMYAPLALIALGSCLTGGMMYWAYLDARGQDYEK